MGKNKKERLPISELLIAGNIDIPFLITVLLLLGIGLVMMYSASYPSAYDKYEDGSYYIKRQLGFAVVGLIIMFAVSFVNPKIYRQFMVVIWLVSIFLLVVVLFAPGTDRGFHRWLNLGPLGSFQPSEIVKASIVLTGAYFYSKYFNSMSSEKEARTPLASFINNSFGANIVRESWIPTWRFGVFFVLCAALVIAEKHLSGFILIFLSGVVMMFLGGVKFKWFAILTPAALVAVVVGCVVIMKHYEGVDVVENYMIERIVAWLNKDYVGHDTRWQTEHGLYALSLGGVFGRGLGNSTQKHLYVSEPQNDMIFPICCEELGLVGALVIIGLFAFLVYRGIKIGLKSTTRFGALTAMGLSIQLGIQVVLNMGVSTDGLPNTGITLPFFSYGGSSLIMTLVEMGVILAISRQSKYDDTPEKDAPKRKRKPEKARKKNAT